MWRREQRNESGHERAEADLGEGLDRRAYYRVTGHLPIRVFALAPHEVDAAVFDLSLPDPLLQPVEIEGDEGSVLSERLRRIEEKLDLLLGAAAVEAPKRLSGRDRKLVTFSGAGIALPVTTSFAKGDAFKIDLLLPPPYARTLRAVGIAVADSVGGIGEGDPQTLPLALTYMEAEERDALVAYSYDLQRFALRTRGSDGESA